MDSIQHLLSRCLGELRQWLAEAAHEPRQPNDVYARIERLLRQLRRIQSAEETERLVLRIEHLVRDEGPVSDDFLPTLEDLHEAASRANP